MTLHAQGLTLALGGRPVLKGVDLSLNPGEVTAVVGPNGAGKSTLLACLAGLRRPDAGSVRLDAEPILSLPPRRRARRIGFLPQTPEIAWAVDVETLVGLGRTPFLGVKGPTAEDRTAVDRALDAADAAVFRGRIANSLSGGERARVLIARALAGEPEWLLADEPLAGLDPGHQLDALALFRRLAHEDGRGVVLTLHDLSLALRLADRVVVLTDGRKLADGAPEAALQPETIAAAYGVRMERVEGQGGPLLELVGRAWPR
jgi:iron complex transport system ATP-binding protein